MKSLQQQKGNTQLEYILIAALIGVALLAFRQTFRDSAQGFHDRHNAHDYESLEPIVNTIPSESEGGDGGEG